MVLREMIIILEEGACGKGCTLPVVALLLQIQLSRMASRLSGSRPAGSMVGVVVAAAVKWP